MNITKGTIALIDGSSRFADGTFVEVLAVKNTSAMIRRCDARGRNAERATTWIAVNHLTPVGIDEPMVKEADMDYSKDPELALQELAIVPGMHLKAGTRLSIQHSTTFPKGEIFELENDERIDHMDKIVRAKHFKTGKVKSFYIKRFALAAPGIVTANTAMFAGDDMYMNGKRVPNRAAKTVQNLAQNHTKEPETTLERIRANAPWGPA